MLYEIKYRPGCTGPAHLMADEARSDGPWLDFYMTVETPGGPTRLRVHRVPAADIAEVRHLLDNPAAPQPPQKPQSGR